MPQKAFRSDLLHHVAAHQRTFLKSVKILPCGLFYYIYSVRSTLNTATEFPVYTRLTELGFEPRLLSDELLQNMINRVREHAVRIKLEIILPRVTWQRAS